MTSFAAKFHNLRFNGSCGCFVFIQICNDGHDLWVLRSYCFLYLVIVLNVIFQQLHVYYFLIVCVQISSEAHEGLFLFCGSYFNFCLYFPFVALVIIFSYFLHGFLIQFFQSFLHFFVPVFFQLILKFLSIFNIIFLKFD